MAKKKFANHIINTDGTHTPYPHKFKNGKNDLSNAQAAVGGLVQLVELGDGTTLLINEEGLMRKLLLNTEATELYREAFAPHKGIIVGNVIRMDSRDIA